MAHTWRVWMAWLEMKLRERTGSSWSGLRMATSQDQMLVSLLRQFLQSVFLDVCTDYCTLNGSSLQVLGATFPMNMTKSSWTLQHGNDSSTAICWRETRSWSPAAVIYLYILNSMLLCFMMNEQLPPPSSAKEIKSCAAHLVLPVSS